MEELGPTGPILGAVEGLTFEARTVALQTGDALAVYTGGLTDAGPKSDAFLGVAGLTALLQAQPPRDKDATGIVAQVMRGVEAHALGSLRDDACCWSPPSLKSPSREEPFPVP